MELKLPVYRVEVGLKSFLIRGDFQPRGDFVIYLNDSAHTYLRFEKVSLSPIYPDYQIRAITQPFISVNRRNIVYVAVLQSEQAELIQVMQSKRAVIFYTDWCAIQGNLHVNTESRDDDLLDRSREFYAVSDASIYPIRAINQSVASTAPCVLVNRQALTAYHVDHRTSG